jgi:guanylate kinase
VGWVPSRKRTSSPSSPAADSPPPSEPRDEERGRLFVVSGPSGAGKGTLIAAALKKRPEVVLTVSATTRPARMGERHGIDYTFISLSEFLRLRETGAFLESAKVYGNYYGTLRGQVAEALAAGRDVIVEVDIQGAEAIKRSMPEATLIFVEPPSLDDLAARLRGRGTEDPSTFVHRIKAAYEEVKSKSNFDHVIINDDLERAVAAFVRILDEPKPRKD